MAAWMVAGGETGECIRAFDWSSTPLGPLEMWPQSLRSSVNFMLEARQPVYLGWGADSISLYNDGYVEILADKHPGAIGKPYRLLWPELWDEYRPHVDAVMAGQAQYWVDQPVMLADRPGQSISWFTFSWTPLRDEDGAIAGFICVANETTGKILAVQQLITSMEEGYCTIELIFGDDARPVDYRFLESNPALERQAGLKNVDGKTIKALVPDVEQEWIDFFGAIATTGKPIRVIKESPTLGRWFEVYAFRVLGTASQVGVLFRDITERKSFEQELKAASGRKDEFLAMLAHELRNPLAPIATAADLLQMPGLDETRVSQASDIIRRQVRHMTGLVDDLLDVSRITRGMVKLNNDPVQIGLAVQDALEQVKSLIHARRHRLLLDLSPEVLMVSGDMKRLTQVIANLLNNAAKYTPERGIIELKVNLRNEEICLDVIDNGIGMEAELMPHVFDLFSQATRTPDRSSGGLGIGLALVKSIVELHAGTVACASDGIGKGSRFTVRLPALAAGQEGKAPHDDAGAVPPGTRPLRIMIVDDNVDAATMLSMMLETMGHQVVLAHDARRALERAEAESPEVFLLDIGLPDIDGYELARRLSALPQFDQARLIAITGYGQEQDMENSVAAGFDHHLVKPVDAARLAALLSAMPAPESSESRP